MKHTLLFVSLVAINGAHAQTAATVSQEVSAGGGRAEAAIDNGISTDTYVFQTSVGGIGGPVATAPTPAVRIEHGFIGTLGLVIEPDPAEDSGPADGVADSWTNLHGITTFDPNRDADQDGLNDLLEAAFNLDPNVPDAASAFSSSLFSDGGEDYLELVFRRHRWHPGIVLTPERSLDLVTLPWLESGITEIRVIILDEDTEEVTVRSDAPVSAEAKQFLRLRADYNPNP